MTFAETIVIAIVEGLTEFLPVSSTGHMIIAQHYMGTPSNEFVKAFTVSIQFGAILSVVLLYWKRFFTNDFSFYLKLFLGFLPAAVIGFLADDYIDSMLGNVLVVAVSLIVGGFILLFVDALIKNNEKQEVSYVQSVIIGFFQCIAMIPGVSRSAATIIGGMTQGLTRKVAAEFSFFLAVPTMLAASGYKLLKSYKLFTKDDYMMLAVGNVVAFVVAILAIKFFINFLTKYGFKVFGYYRIVVGGIILALYFAGYNMVVN
ncbi:MAG TPA: undecaprenyl-diphosphate phosphatase [Flavobacteriales bacterium]|nr:undecaprenyl-diphosphate phosphatase [Flavobacteriales bacterium]